MIRRLHSDQSGFTLVELLTAMTIGLVVLMAAFLLLDRATSVSQEISDRQDAVQRGRVAMEHMVRALRSQVCLGEDEEPITDARDDLVTFYVDLSDGSKLLERRTLRYDAASKNVYEDRYLATGGTYPALTWPAAPTFTRLLVSGAEPILEDDGSRRPMFQYYAFKASSTTPGDMERLGTPLSAESTTRTVLVKVAFTVLPDRRVPDNRDATTLESDVYVRLADPSRPLEGPRCI